MTWHVDFRDDRYVAGLGVGNDFFEFRLGVETAVGNAIIFVCVVTNDCVLAHGADFGESWEFFDFDSPALVVGEVEVECVDFVDSEGVNKFFDFIFG